MRFNFLFRNFFILFVFYLRMFSFLVMFLLSFKSFSIGFELRIYYKKRDIIIIICLEEFC